MNFLRKLFPISKKKKNESSTSDSTKPSSNEIPLEIENEKIPIENIVTLDNQDNTTDHDSSNKEIINNVSTDSDKILHTLENVAPIVIHPISNPDIEPDLIEILTQTIEINDDIVNEEAYISHESTFDTETLQLLNKTDNARRQREVTDDLVSKEVVLNHIIHNNETDTFPKTIDNDTLQNIREFEETLNNYDKSACINEVSEQEFINLDEINDIFDSGDSFEEDSNTVNNAIKCEYECNENKDFNYKRDGNNITIKNITKSYNNDIISITSSTENEECQTVDMQIPIIVLDSDSEEPQSSDCEGYNSSDFEFISETEAKMDGFIINFPPKNNNDNVSQASSELSTFSDMLRETESKDDAAKDISDPGEGPSGLNKPRNEFQDRSYRNNHVVPIGDDYLGLFQGIYNPLMSACEIHFMENKSVRASAMNAQYDGMGFDKQLAIRRPQPDSSEDEFADEANECAQKIRNMYPAQNRKRRRRY